MDEMLTSGAEMDAVEMKRAKLMARLQQRHANSGGRSVQLIEKKSAEMELDRLIEQARSELSRGEVVIETVKRLEESLSLQCGGRNVKRIQDVLEASRKATLANDVSFKRPAFSFVKRPSSVNPAAKNVAPPPPLPADVPSPKKESVLPSVEPHVNDTAVRLEDKTNFKDCISGEEGSSISLKNLTNCTIRFSFRASAVHIQNIKNCTLYFLPIRSSILLHEAENCSIFASAQQIRVHDSKDVNFHVFVKGAIIFETCTRMRMAPYRMIHGGVPVVVPEGEQWRHPSDFDWLAEGQSPNWSILPESEWSEGSI